VGEVGSRAQSPPAPKVPSPRAPSPRPGASARPAAETSPARGDGQRSSAAPSPRETPTPSAEGHRKARAGSLRGAGVAGDEGQRKPQAAAPRADAPSSSRARARPYESRRDAERRAETRSQRLWFWGGGAFTVLIVGGIAAFIVVGILTATSLQTAPLSTLGTLAAAPAAGPLSTEDRVPIPQAAALAPQGAAGKTVDGIACDSGTGTPAVSFNSWLTVFVNGQQKQVPAGAGVVQPVINGTGADDYVEGQQCLFWVATHAPDGVINVRSPTQRGFTLGDFFDAWGQPLSSSQVGPDKGSVTVLYNADGSRGGWVVDQGDPSKLPLGSHTEIQLEVGGPLVAPQTLDWSGTKL